jgi:DNA mismatch endonuclease (patch repair protein)
MSTRCTDARSENMRRIRGKDTAPELTVRRLLHAMGYRYRLHVTSLPGRPDIVMAGRKKVVFIHGCFWHQHWRCRLAHKPHSNRDYWDEKLRRNVERDRTNRRRLRRLGWSALVVWECQTRDAKQLKRVVESFLGPDRP